MDTTTLKLKNEELAKKINEIDQYCKKNNIPYFFAVPTANESEGTTYFYSYLSPGVAEIKLTDDKISKMMNVANGFNTVPPVPIPEICFKAP